MTRRTSAALLLTIALTPGAWGGGFGSPIVRFEQVDLPSTAGKRYTSLAIGPDVRLYGLAEDGQLRRWCLEPDGRTGPAEILFTLQSAEAGFRRAIGLVFDPAASADELIAWVSHSTFGFMDVPDWGGKVSRLSGPDLETVEDYLVGLPRSVADHLTNGLAFGPDGALYIVQGSNSAMGAPDEPWGFRPERALSAAVLRLDVRSERSWPIDVQTAEGGTYDPSAPDAALTVFASGLRNAFDLHWHENGQLYVPTNGSAAGGNTPAAGANALCAGINVVGLAGVGSQPDFLYRVEPGGYYGHPNPQRCEFVLNGGNPTAGVDPAEVVEYPVGTVPDANYRGHAFDFGGHRSPNGIIGYRSDRFGDALRGRLLVVRYSQGDDLIALTPGGDDLDIVEARTGIPGLSGLDDPLDLVENPANGYLYVSEYGASRVRLLRPVACPADVNGDGAVDVQDLVGAIANWGTADPGADVDGDGIVDAQDLVQVLLAWGQC